MGGTCSYTQFRGAGSQASLSHLSPQTQGFPALLPKTSSESLTLPFPQPNILRRQGEFLRYYRQLVCGRLTRESYDSGVFPNTRTESNAQPREVSHVGGAVSSPPLLLPLSLCSTSSFSKDSLQPLKTATWGWLGPRDSGRTPRGGAGHSTINWSWAKLPR